MQYPLVLQDIVKRVLSMDGAAVAATVPVTVRSALYPDDVLSNLDGGQHGGLLRTDQTVQQAHIESGYLVAQKLGREMTNSAARLGQLAGACAQDAVTANDEMCLRMFIQKFGRLALRRPLDTEEVDFFRGIAGTTPVAAVSVANVIALFLASLEFTYVIEGGRAETSPGRAPLTTHPAFAVGQRMADAREAGEDFEQVGLVRRAVAEVRADGFGELCCVYFHDAREAIEAVFTLRPGHFGRGEASPSLEVERLAQRASKCIHPGPGRIP